MKIRILAFIVILLVVPVSMFAQQEYQKVYVDNAKSAIQRYEKGCELYEREMFAAAIIELEASILDIEELYLKERAKFYIAHSRAILQQKYTNSILEEYIHVSQDNVFKNEALVILADNNLLLENLDSTRVLIKRIDHTLLSPKALASYRYVNAYLMLNDGYKDVARELFLQVSTVPNKHKVDAIYYLGYIAYLNGDYQYALDSFQKAISLGGTYSKTDAYIAQIKFAEGDYTYIIQNQDKLLKYNEDKSFLAEINRMIALSYYNAKDYVSAIDFMNVFTSLGGVNGRSEYYILGYSYYMMNNYNKAIEQFVNILDDKDAIAQSTYYLLGDSYIKIGNKLNAMKAFGMAADMNFDTAISEDALYNFAKLTYEIDKSTVYTNKIEALNRYYTKYPNSKHRDEISGYMLNIYINNGDLLSAMDVAERVKTPSPEVKKALQRTYFDQGLKLFENKEYDAAIKMFEKSSSYNVASKYAALSNFWIAESRFSKGEYNNDVVWLYKKYQSASTPSTIEWQMANYSIGYTYFNTKEWGYAITWFNKFIDGYKGVDKNLIRDAYIRIADSWFARRDYSKANANYSKANELFSDDYLDYQRAVTYGMMGNNTDKIKSLKSIIATAKSQYYEEAIMELTTTYFKLSQFQDAKQVAVYMINNCKGSVYYPKAIANLAIAEANMGNSKAAKEAYQRVVREYPVSEEAKGSLIALKSIYVASGDVDGYFAFVNSVGGKAMAEAGDKEQLLFESVQHLYSSKSFDRAVEEGLKYIKSYPEGVNVIDVTYYVADSYYRMDNDKLALEYLGNIAEMPQNQYSVASNSQIAAISIRLGDNKNAYRALCGVVKYSTEPTERKDALERSMSVALLTEDNEIIKEAYRAVLATTGVSSEALSKAWYAYGKDLYLNKEYKKAAEQFKKVKMSRQNVIEIESLYLIAECYYNIGEYVNAEKGVMDLANGDTPHQYWVAKGFILLGDIYLKKGDKFQAKATYKSIVDGYGLENDGIKDLAQEKLKELLK